jgi:tRNA (guanine37-N1)-methyltransferase
LLDYPHYTRPVEFRGVRVPEVLLSGNHRAIERWRKEQSIRATCSRRPELLAEADLDPEELAILAELSEVPG